MDGAMISLDRRKGLSDQIYAYFRGAIEGGEIKPGERLPSIRELAGSVSVSKITVERAYAQLFSEGYIEGGNRRRYSAARLWPEEGAPRDGKEGRNSSGARPRGTVQSPPEFDFSAGDMDPGGFDFSVWRRYISRALDGGERLMKYGDAWGEPELRREIAAYVRGSRGAAAEPERIVVGPSVRSLLGILASLLKDGHEKIAFEDPGFKSGRRVFSDCGYEICPVGMERDGMDIGALEKTGAALVYTSPSHQFPGGSIMPVGKRNRLLDWAGRAGGLIIEDDYDSEFRYYGNPIPALKGLDRGNRVCYLGSFSKIIPPSLRISFMLLPEALAEKFAREKSFYSQGASVPEQLALAEFMAEGRLDRQVRRLRKIYMEKRRIFLDCLREELGDGAKIRDGGSGLFVTVGLELPLSPGEVKSRAAAEGCRVALLRDFAYQSGGETGEGETLILYFSGIPEGKIPEAVRRLKTAWF